MRIIGVSVPVLTANIESATARYGSLLGEEVKARFVMPGRGLTLALFGNVTLIGGAERDLARVKDLRATFTVDSLAEFEAHLRSWGATILQPPAPTPAGKNMVVRDVEGLEFELVEPMNRRMTW
ncbi:MAG TPA: VOC family protein [Gemmatimonadales bacterium]